MNRNSIGKFAGSGAVAALVIFMTPETHATSWCPTPTDNQITCSNCSRELSCDVNGFGINILGNDVTLDGKNHWIEYAPNNAVNVQGFATTIRYLYTYDPGYASIQFNASSSGGVASTVDHVYLYSGNGGKFGVLNQAAHEVAISNSEIYDASQSGIQANSSQPTDFTYSFAAYNLDGWWGSATGSNSMIVNSTFEANDVQGLFANNVTGLIVSGSTFNDNNYVGLYMNNVSGSVKNNHGVRSGSWDCFESHGGTLNISHSGNYWGIYSGAGCP